MCEKKSLSVTIQMAAIELHLPVLLFTMLYRMFLSFGCTDETLPFDDLNETTNLCFPVLYRVVLTFQCRWMKFLNVTIQMKGIEHFFPVVLFIN